MKLPLESYSITRKSDRFEIKAFGVKQADSSQMIIDYDIHHDQTDTKEKMEQVKDHLSSKTWASPELVSDVFEKVRKHHGLS